MALDLDSPPPFDPNDPDEERALRVVLMGFKFYRSESHLQITHSRRINAYSLPPQHRKILFDPPISLLSTFTKLDECIAANADFLEHILATAFLAFDVDADAMPPSMNALPPEMIIEVRDQVDKIRSVVRQFVRDWSVEGFDERAAVYGRMLRALSRYYPDAKGRAEVKVLVPGAGLGRLALDIAGMGFWSQGNEWSYSMLAASQFILNCTKERNQFTIFPFIGNFSHRRSREEQTRGVQIPDTHPSEVLRQDPEKWTNPYESLLSPTKVKEEGQIKDSTADRKLEVNVEDSGCDSDGSHGGSDRFSMVAGDFTQCYRVAAQFDCVCTSFFLDTASNPLLYIDVIYHTLKPGGLWINTGPLLWHWDGKKKEGGTVELTLEELIQVISSRFTILERESDISTGYTADKVSMGHWTYDTEFWVARKD